MSIHGLYFITVRRYPHSKKDFLVDICEDMNEAARTEHIEGRERLKEFLGTYTPKDMTLEQIMQQMMLDARPGEQFRKFQFCATDTTPKN